MIITEKENNTDRISLYIEHKNQKYLCERFIDHEYWFRCSMSKSEEDTISGIQLISDDDKIEELEKLLKNYYRKKKLIRL